jgi:hypothetical protein
VVWAPDETAPDASLRSTGAGRAVVSANEEVLCWDVKKESFSADGGILIAKLKSQQLPGARRTGTSMLWGKQVYVPELTGDHRLRLLQVW